MDGLAASMIGGGGEGIFLRVTEEVEGKKGAQVKYGLGTGLI